MNPSLMPSLPSTTHVGRSPWQPGQGVPVPQPASLQGPPPAAGGPEDNSTEVRIKSDTELLRALAGSIHSIQTGYLDIYDRMITRYTAFYKELTEFTARLPKYISEGSDQNHIKVDIGKIHHELRALRRAWRSVTLFGPSAPAAAQKWSSEWKLPFTGYATATDARVVIDTAPLDAMIEATGKVSEASYNAVSLSDASQSVNWLLGQYQAWDTAMTEQRKQIQTKVTTLNEQYSHAISIFDNVIKILSSTIGTLYESEKAYLNF